MIERVWIQHDFARMGHYVAIVGRQYPGGPTSVLQADGEWKPIEENGLVQDWAGFRLPEGALDALMAEYQKVSAPVPATERHLNDAIEVRDRLLALVEKKR